MLIAFSVTNWKSFKDTTTLSMVAGKETQHADHIQYIPEYKLNVLPIAVVFGSNASGKSNLVKALDFAANFVRSTNFDPNALIDIDYFRLDGSCASAPSIFDFKISINETLYQYQFSLLDGKVEGESLIRLKGKRAITVFERVHGEFLKTEKSIPKESVEFLRGCLPNKLAISNVVLRKNEGLEDLERVYEWFRFNLVVLSPNSRLIRFDDQSLPVEKLSSVMSKLDTGISKIDFIKIPGFKDLPSEVSGFSELEIRNVEQMLKSGSKVVWSLNVRDDFYRFAMQDGKLQAAKMVSYHKSIDGKDDIKFEIRENSDGTRRCLHLFTAFNGLVRPESVRCYVIDELDRSLHTNLVRQLLISYLATRNQDCRSQLIITNHDVLQMDQDILRRDEISIMEQKEGSSSLCNLNEYTGIRKDRVLPKLYLDGQLGGVPDLKDYGNLFDFE